MNSTLTYSHPYEKVDSEFPIFSKLAEREHEQVVVCSEPNIGLRAFIAIHDTTLGPALGGVRMWPYKNEDEALRDVLRLSRGMTYKAAISHLNLGGGKAVIIGDPKKDKSEELFRAFGRYIEGLGGRYITAEDVGIDPQDMEWVRMETKYVTGIPQSLGGSGDPSPVTAQGVYMGIKACAQKAYGDSSLSRKSVAIQGAGHVSSHLAEFLQKEGAELYICDIDEEKANKVAGRTGAKVVDPEDIYDLDVDIYSPCALGGVINDETIERLSCHIIAGAANNVLEEESVHGPQLMDKGIIYAPDYVINAGGLINVSSELEGYNYERAHNQAARIYDVILDILHYADQNNIHSHQAANILAEERINKMGKIKKIYTSKSNFSGRLGEMYLRDRS